MALCGNKLHDFWFGDPKHCRQIHKGSAVPLVPFGTLSLMRVLSSSFLSFVLIPLFLCFQAKYDERVSNITVCHSSRKEIQWRSFKEVKSTDLVAKGTNQWHRETKDTQAQTSSTKETWMSKCGCGDKFDYVSSQIVIELPHVWQEYCTVWYCHYKLAVATPCWLSSACAHCCGLFAQANTELPRQTCVWMATPLEPRELQLPP